jgi:hypothetical protein
MSFRYGRYTVEHPTGPDEHHSYAPAPGLALVLASQGVTYEALSELTGYPVEYLRKMAEEGQIAPRIVTSRISAVLGVEHTVIRGEQPGEVTRVEDVITPDDD